MAAGSRPSKYGFAEYHRALNAFADLVVYDQSPSAGHPNPQASSADDVLTRREIEVLKLITTGLSTKQVAVHLDISFKTAASYRSRIMEKLNIHDVVTLVWYAIDSNLVTLESSRQALT